MPDIARAISCLTYDEIEQHFDDGTTRSGIGVPLLQRSISIELREIEAALGAKGKTRLFALAEAIDEALLALTEEP